MPSDSVQSQPVDAVRKDHDHPGHFVGAADCKFFRHTHVAGRWCVSTVGDYHPPSLGGKREPIGHNRTHETMVFNLDPDGEAISDWTEIDFAPYRSDAEAAAGHEEMVAKYIEAASVAP